MKKTLAVLTLAVAAVALAPRPVTAQEATCTDNYTKCMNDSWMTSGWLETMADIECFGDYVACVGKKIAQI